MNLTNKKILVTGASGFIGFHLCQRLRASGGIVHAVSRKPTVSGSEDLIWWARDVAEINAVRELFEKIKPDFIYHLASHVMGAPSLEHVLPTFRNNLLTSVNLLTAAAEFGCGRLVLTGSLAEPEQEKGENFPSAPYAAAKWASSAYGRMFHALYGVPVVLARVFMVYGPAQKDLSKLVPYVILSILRGEAPEITSGKRLLDWIYVDDVIDGYLSLAEIDGIEGATVEIGSGQLTTIREIVSRIADLMGSRVSPQFGVLPDRPMEPVRIADVAKTYRQIGWKPATSLDAGLRKTINWYRDHFDELTMPNRV